MESYLRVNFLGPGHLLMRKEFTGPRSHKGWETLIYRATGSSYRKFLFRNLLDRVRGSPCVGLLLASRMYVTVEVTVNGPTVERREYELEGLRTAWQRSCKNCTLFCMYRVIRNDCRGFSNLSYIIQLREKYMHFFWRDQLHLEDQGTGNTPNPSGTWWWWWWWCICIF